MERNIEKKYKINFRVIESTAQQEIDKPYPIIHKQHSSAIWQCFFSYLKDNNNWDLFRIYELDEKKQPEILKEAKASNLTIRINRDKSGPTINLDQSWQEYLSQHKKMRKKINRFKNQSDRKITFKVYENSIKALSTYKDIEERSWKKGKIGISKNVETYQFYQAICLSMTQNENTSMKIGILYIDDFAVSGEIAYTYQDKVYFCQGCYDDNYANFSPGMISTAYFIQNFMEQNFSDGDFLCGYAGYLDAWSDDVIKTKQIDLYNKTLRTRIFFIYRGIRKISSYLLRSVKHE